MGEAATQGAHARRQITPGTQIGRYRVLRRMAAGGMAEVYLARPEGGSLARPVALKLVLPHLAQEPKFVELFQHEARVALLVDHPNIAHVLELDRDGSELFLVMEFVDGHTLQDVLATSQGPLPLACALSLLSQTCAAIHHAHEAKRADGSPLQLVHRDISPSNVMVRHDGVVKVVDFGIAKALSETGLTKTGSLKGKSGYMSPEQCRGQALDRRSDVFNLGILLYEVTTGRRAFGGANMFAVMNKIVDGRFSPPSKHEIGYPAELESIVLKAMSLDPEGRHPTAHALREEIEAFARERSLALSEPVVASAIEGLMGAPQPVELGPAVGLPEATPEAGIEPPPGGRVPAWVKAAAVGMAAGAVAFAALLQTEVEPESAPEPASERAVANESPEPPNDPGDPGDPAVAAPASVNAVEEVAHEDEAALVAEPDPKPEPQPPRRKKRGKGKKKAAKKKPQADPLFPWKEESK